MTLSELQAQVGLGEDSRRQFKQDMQSPDALAVEMTAFANSDGGVIFLAVADDGSLPGLSLADVSRLNQMISTVAAQHVCSPLMVLTANMELGDRRLVADFFPSACYTYLKHKGTVHIRT
jgi:ATP-dependent DNA helicase RecG